MRLRRELADPWGLVTAGVMGGLAWAVASGPAAIAAGAGVAAAVYGVRVVAGAIAHRSRTPADAPLPPRRGSPAEALLRRAEQAVGTLREQTESAREPTLRAQIAGVDDEARTVLAALRRLGGQVRAVEDAMSRIDVARLQYERGRLEAQSAGADESVRSERGRAAAAVREQLAVATRLNGTREMLLARMESVAIGLDGLVARLAEVLALAQTAGGVDSTGRQLADLSGELDGLRSGLAETEEASRRALAAE